MISRRQFAQSIFAALCFQALTSAPSVGQQLNSIFPAGCCRGATTEIVLHGSKLDSATSLHFSHPGIGAELIEKNRFRVTVDESAGPGDYDVWVATPDGLSNPRRFVVDEIAGVVEADKNDSLETAQQISLPSVVDARLDRPAEMDWYRFDARQDQHVTISCRSWSLDGSVEPSITVIDPNGRETLHSSGHRREPLLHFRAQKTGVYHLCVCDRAYRKDDYSFYRLALMTGPRLLSAFPHLLPRGKLQRVKLVGFELPNGQSINSGSIGDLQQLEAEIVASIDQVSNSAGRIDSTSVDLDTFRYRHDGAFGDVCFRLADESVVTEQENENDRREHGQLLEVPCHVVGRFLTSGDVDWYRFSAKKGETLNIEGFGERCGQLMDLDVAIYDSKNKLLKNLSDIAAQKGFPAKFPLASLDAAETWKAPNDGDYFLVVRDLYGGSVFGRDRIYQLSIRKPRPSFHVVAMHADDKAPRGHSIRCGEKAELQLITIRRGGFKETIIVRGELLPAGVTLDEKSFEVKKVTDTISLSAGMGAAVGVGTLQLVAEVELDGEKRSVQVRGATLVRSGSPVAARLTEEIPICVLPAK